MRKLAGTGGALAVAVVVLFVGGVLVNGTVSALSAKQASRRSTGAGFLIRRGRHIFRYDTFGDQAFWGGALQLHKAIEGRKLGGVGPGVSPKTALAVGLKVDAAKIPSRVAAAIKAGKVDLNSPKTTLALLKLNAVVGVRGFFNSRGTLRSMGLSCAVCHSTVDNSFAPGIGRRLDGWPNQDLNVGKIISLAPNPKPLTSLLGVDDATLKKVLLSWGPGKFDAELEFDGKAFQPNGRSGATRIPPAFGLAGVNLHTYTGWGAIPHWNALVANLEMHGIGNFDDDRLANKDQFPIAAKAGFAHVRHKRDLITSKLPALEVYQLSLPAPRPPRGSFDRAAARRGKAIFDGRGKCASCHMPPLFTDAGWNLHTGGDVCIDSFESHRSPTMRYRTTPLRGLFAKSKRGFYHDGRFRTLKDVVNHYDSCLNLHLGKRGKSDLVQYLKSL
jgi:mono/diheme cytochrome c family protein